MAALDAEGRRARGRKARQTALANIRARNAARNELIIKAYRFREAMPQSRKDNLEGLAYLQSLGRGVNPHPTEATLHFLARTTGLSQKQLRRILRAEIDGRKKPLESPTPGHLQQGELPWN
ncbi:MAG: hypothetical protein WDA10_12710 [Porticoccaceae bacterium]|jgi:hypothetical protein|nr:hypothetical protein [Porticoccaceae bacterium]MEA3299979.1 hypothetical protein [Pseudomonadota bacterium]HLS99166.1 hypothetical protein [Porticoccaceae bacterium]